MQRLIHHHDNLRSYFSKAANSVVQVVREAKEVEISVEQIDLTKSSTEEQQRQILQIKEQMEASFNEESDLLIKAALLDLGADGQRLLITAHQLLLDDYSWRILLADMTAIYESDFTRELGAKTLSYKEWSEWLHNLAGEINVEYWENIPLAAQILDAPQLDAGRFAEIALSFDTEMTENLLKKANTAYNTRTEDLLLTAFNLSLMEVFGLSQLLVNLYAGEREEILNIVDVSATIGCFAYHYPVWLEQRDSLENTIKHVKETLRRVSPVGLYYSVGSYLANNEKLQALKPQVSFTCRTITPHASDALFVETPELNGVEALPAQTELIQLQAVLTDDTLRLTIVYNEAYLEAGKLQELAASYLCKIAEVSEHCTTKEGTTFTASDFGVSDKFDEDDFENLAKLYDFEG